MNLASIFILVTIFTVTLYVVFLVLGLGGISKNRRAQGIDQNHRIDNNSL